MATEDNGKVWNFTNTPLYHDAGDGLQLIGITHQSFPRSQPTSKIMNFRRVVTSLDHVAFEGYSRYMFDLRPNKGYEDLAISIARGQKHFLDQGANYAAGLERLGMPVSLYGFLRAAKAVDDTPPVGPEHFAVYIRDSLTGISVEAPHSAISSGLASRIVLHLPNIVGESCRLAEERGDCATLREVVKSFKDYLFQFRDTAVYAPRLRELQQLSGRKGAIVGVAHVLSLAALLSGNGPELPSWNDYVAGAPAPIQESLGRMERYIAKNFHD